MKYLVILSALLFCNCSYSTDVLIDEGHKVVHPSRDISHCDYDELNLMHSKGLLAGHEDEAIVALKKELEECEDAWAYRLIGLLYESKHDHTHAIENIRHSIELMKEVLQGVNISHYTVFEDLKRLESQRD